MAILVHIHIIAHAVCGAHGLLSSLLLPLPLFFSLSALLFTGFGIWDGLSSCIVLLSLAQACWRATPTMRCCVVHATNVGAQLSAFCQTTASESAHECTESNKVLGWHGLCVI